MNAVLDAIRNYSINFADTIALASRSRSFSFYELYAEVRKLADSLHNLDCNVIGLHLDNGIDWVLVDLAAQLAGITVVPIPLFFTPGQIQHVVNVSGADGIISFNEDIARMLAVDYSPEKISSSAWYLRFRTGNPCKGLQTDGTGKITYTSGTTGTPKGVCLSNDCLSGVALSLVEAVASIETRSHLCLLPLATLLENVAGIYAPLLKGGTCYVPSLHETGLADSSQFDIYALIECIEHYRPDSIILLPQMLLALANAVGSGVNVPACLKFIAVGGGKVSPVIIKKARASGLPVYEGYGLSECGSVVTLNTPQSDRIGSVGRKLPHVDIRIAPDGEILIKGQGMIGYLGEPAARNTGWFASGDRGYLDENGFLFINGRKKNIFISSFGRNISPEWPESELVSSGVIKQCVVFGEAREANCAVIVPADNSVEESLIDNAISVANQNLPDYAKIRFRVRAKESFHAGNGLATANGRLLREKIYRVYSREIDRCYGKSLVEADG